MILVGNLKKTCIGYMCVQLLPAAAAAALAARCPVAAPCWRRTAGDLLRVDAACQRQLHRIAPCTPALQRRQQLQSTHAQHVPANHLLLVCACTMSTKFALLARCTQRAPCSMQQGQSKAKSRMLLLLLPLLCRNCCSCCCCCCSPCPVDLPIVVDLLLDVHLAVWGAKAADLVLLLVILPARIPQYHNKTV